MVVQAPIASGNSMDRTDVKGVTEGEDRLSNR